MRDGLPDVGVQGFSRALMAFPCRNIFDIMSLEMVTISQIFHCRNLSGFYTSDFPDEPPYYFDFVADSRDDSTHPLKGTKVKVLEYGEEVEIVFQSTNLLNASDEHSMYIHGHKFYVLGEGYGNFNSTRDPETYNLVDPPYLSTASLPVKGWLTIRFKANNPGNFL